MGMLSVADALQKILAAAPPLPVQDVPLGDALGRVLADDLVARRTQPPAPVSAMDGYAVRGADVMKAPATLTVIGEIPAGKPFPGTVNSGEAARIFTGGVLPRGADTVVIQEHTKRDGNTVTVCSPTETGRNVRREGIDFRAGDRLLAKGTRLTDRALMLAAAMNYPTVPVIRPPKVAVLGTGDELVMPGTEPGPGEIVYSNGYALVALARGEGATVTDLGVARDDIANIAAAIARARAAGADILVTSGGASVGDHDLVQRALKEQGLQLSFWRIAMRPGRPMMHGRLKGMHVLGVPGNPVSSYVCAFLFLVPLIRKMAGRSDLAPAPLMATLGVDLPENDERADYLRAVLKANADGSLVATPMSFQDSSLMARLAKADCLVIREPHAPPAKAGSRCLIVKLGL